MEIPAYAKTQASMRFATAGVKPRWLCSKECAEHPSQAIVMTFSLKTPGDLLPGALAYALPFEGSHVEIFHGRILKANDANPAPILAHVLVHEITHILQGTNRHSATGVMKASWDNTDYARMRTFPLPLEPTDMFLIQRGLDARAARNTPMMAAAVTDAVVISMQ